MNFFCTSLGRNGERMLYIQSLWSELADYFYRTFIDPAFPYFYHLSNRMEGYTVVLAIAAVFVGVLTAGTVYVYQKRVIGAFPRALIAADALSEENARTAQELGIKLGWAVRLSMRRRTSALRKYVRYVGQVDPTYEDYQKRRVGGAEQIDFESARFYVLPEKRIECSSRFNMEKTGTWGTVAWAWGGGILLFFLVCSFLPRIMSVVDWVAGLMP